MVRSLRVMVPALLCAALAGCAGGGGPMLVSQEQEVAIGQEVARDVEQEYGQPLRSGPYVARLQHVAQPLLQRTQRNIPYQVNVLNNSQVVNAFACPGGPTYITTALMDTMNDDSELAFVVGHELSHNEYEHGRNAINQAVLANAAATILLRDANQLLQIGAQVAWALLQSGYSRQQERQSDSGGLRLAASAGFDPRGSVSALRKLGGGSSSWLSSHPATSERIQRLEEEIQSGYGR